MIKNPRYFDPEYNVVYRCVPEIRKIIYSPPATIVFWTDNSKTVVKCAADETFSLYDGLNAAISKRFFGSNSAIKKFINRNGEFQGD